MGQRRGLTPDSRPERASCPGPCHFQPRNPEEWGAASPARQLFPRPSLSKAYLQPPHPLQPFFKKASRKALLRSPYCPGVLCCSSHSHPPHP